MKEYSNLEADTVVRVGKGEVGRCLANTVGEVGNAQDLDGGAKGGRGVQGEDGLD